MKDSEPDSYDENDMKEKVNDLVRLHKGMQEKLKAALYAEQIQILTLVPDKLSRMYCSECLWIPCLNFKWNQKVGGILAKPAPKKVKTITNGTIHLVTNVYQDDNFSR